MYFCLKSSKGNASINGNLEQTSIVDVKHTWFAVIGYPGSAFSIDKQMIIDLKDRFQQKNVHCPSSTRPALFLPVRL